MSLAARNFITCVLIARCTWLNHFTYTTCELRRTLCSFFFPFLYLFHRRPLIKRITFYPNRHGITKDLPPSSSANIRILRGNLVIECFTGRVRTIYLLKLPVPFFSLRSNFTANKTQTVFHSVSYILMKPLRLKVCARQPATRFTVYVCPYGAVTILQVNLQRGADNRLHCSHLYSVISKPLSKLLMSEYPWTAGYPVAIVSF